MSSATKKLGALSIIGTGDQQLDVPNDPFSIVQPTNTQQPSPQGAVQSAVQSADQSADLPPHLKKPIARAFSILKTLFKHDHAYVIVARRRQSATVVFASGHFAASLDTVMSERSEPLSSLLKLRDTAVFSTEPNRDETIDPVFPTLPTGSLAVLPMDLTADIRVLVGVWRSAMDEPFSDADLEALRDFVELTAAAASTANDQEAPRSLRAPGQADKAEDLQRFYRRYSEAIQQCFWTVDTNAGRLVHVSENFEKVWGASPAALEADGLNGFCESVHPEDRDHALSEFHLSLAAPDRTFDLQIRVVDQTGEIRWMWIRSVWQVPEDGLQTPYHANLILIAEDVTEKKQKEEALRQSEAESASNAANVAMGDLASGVAQEINNPLTVIIGRAAELKRRALNQDLDADKVAELASIIERTSTRISRVVMSLKALSLADRTYEMRRTPLQAMLTELGDLCSEKFLNANVLLELPEVPPGLVIEMNSTLISQVLMNLLNNAFDAVQSLKERWVKVEVDADEESVYLSVTDSGSGIPIKLRSRIFDPFFSTKGAGKGTGLGLSLARGIALHHNGSLRYDQLHSHTRFTLQLPKRQPLSLKVPEKKAA